eukprot:TRINITY_DN4547_c0_g1_i1.p1 TRINITY_DN4547_c0_g1~~TRINITY_DN4547_c0_g1_i1.p1  ORF type:complete len:344 (-),score=93.77 TRINITY_DN4547_c0_g1_i1:202-1176(-)
MTAFWEFIAGQYTPVPTVWRDLSGKVIVVTGSNTGLGFEAAKSLATMKPAKLIIACRTKSKAETAISEIKSATGYTCDFVPLDLASFDSVKAFSKILEEKYGRLDVLVSNAGVAMQEWTTTSNGWETTLQVNHLANFLLIQYLLPLLRSTRDQHKVEPRIIVVASEVHEWTPYTERNQQKPLAYLNTKEKANMPDRYQVSKLLNLFMTREFAKRLSSEGISIHALNPGWCKSELVRDAKNWGVWIWFKVAGAILQRTTEQGGRTLVHATVSEDLLLKNGPAGRYWSICAEKAPSLTAINEELAQNVWKETLEILSSQLPKDHVK